MNYDDKDTWNLFAEGKTKGVFQLESNLGKGSTFYIEIPLKPQTDGSRSQAA